MSTLYNRRPQEETVDCYLEAFITKTVVIEAGKRNDFGIHGLRSAAGRELGTVSGDRRPRACRITEPRHLGLHP